MNPLAQKLNETLERSNPAVAEMLSNTGRELFMPKGIVTQSMEAKQKAHRYNATIGMAMENGGPMYLESLQSQISSIDVSGIFPYAPTAGVKTLRQQWKDDIIRKNPDLAAKPISMPIVTSGITHGLQLVSLLFVDPDDVVVLPDKLWGNYKMIFSTLRGANIRTFPFYNKSQTGFNTDGYAKLINELADTHKKLITILNFPNNPTGYSINRAEAESIANTLRDTAKKGTRVIAVSDDSYFGLFYEDSIYPQSLFTMLADNDEGILAVKLCGATKEDFAWGFRLGFMTYGNGCSDAATVYNVLETKTTGAIRGTISNANHASQTLLGHALNDSRHLDQIKEKALTLKERANSVKKHLDEHKDRYSSFFSYYPFNSGYFMCLRLTEPIAEKLRVHMLEQYGIGVIAIGDIDIRVAFSCLEKENIGDLFETLLNACQEIMS